MSMVVMFAKLTTKFAYLILVKINNVSWGSATQTPINKIHKCWK